MACNSLGLDEERRLPAKLAAKAAISPAMRRMFLMASPDVGFKFYKEELGFWNVNDEAEHVVCMTRRGFKLG